MKVRTRTTATIEHDDIEIELSFIPYDEPTVVQPSPTKLVVGYLVHDDHCANPMKESDAEGTLYTINQGVITDDDHAPDYLGLNSFGGGRRYGPEYNLDHEGINDRVAEYIHAQVKASPELTAWMVSKVMETGENHSVLLVKTVDAMQIQQSYRGSRMNSNEDHEAIEELGDYETLATKAWHELYDEGKIGAYLAVPVRYMDSCHGPGTTRIETTSLEDANAVWVPDGSAIDNMSFAGCTTYLEKLAVAEKYAASVLSNYAEWANGNCWGVVVETFKLEDGKYEQQEEDSCWGFIGYEYAEAGMKLSIENRVKQLKELA